MKKQFWGSLLCIATGCGADAAAADEALHVHGTLAPELKYRIEVKYQTTNNTPACQESSMITGTMVALEQNVSFDPQLSENTHQVSVPLTAKLAPDACGWKAQVVFLCVGPRTSSKPAAACSSLYFLRDNESAPASPLIVACSAKNLACGIGPDVQPLAQRISRGGDINMELRTIDH